MKTGEERFDNEIRQKVRYSEVTPPPDFFDKIVPPKKNKKRGFWIWMAGIILLLSTITFYTSQKFIDQQSNTSPEIISPDNKSNLNKSQNELNNNSVANEKLTAAESQQQESNDSNTNSAITENRDKTAGSITEHKNESYQFSIPKEKYKKKNTSNADESGINYYTPQSQSNSNQLTNNYDLMNSPAPSLPYDGNNQVTQQIQIKKPDNTEVDSYEPTPYSIEVYYSALSIQTSTSEETADSKSLALLNQKELQDNQRTGFNFGARGVYSLNKKFIIKAGIQYSKMEEDFNFDFDEIIKITTIDTITYFILFPFIPPQQVILTDSIFSEQKNTHSIDHKITTSVFSFTTAFGYSMPMGRFVIEPQLGLSADIYTIFEGQSNYNPEHKLVDASDYYEKNFRIYTTADVQVGYSLSEKMGIFVSGGYRYSFSNYKTTPEFYTDRVNQFNLSAGIKYTFFKAKAAE